MGTVLGKLIVVARPLGPAVLTLLLAAGIGAPIAHGQAQTRPQAKGFKRPAPASLTVPGRKPAPVSAPKPRVQITPSAKPLPTAQLEEALRLLLRADSTARHPARTGTEAEGLVLDQALSKLGHDFYDQFYNRFEAPVGSTDFSIVVSERPARGNTSLVVLTVNDTELLEMPLPTRFDQMEETVAYAVDLAQSFLSEAINVSKQLESGRQAPLETF